MTSLSALRVHDILGPEPEPAFHDEGELVRNWGAKWGASDEVSPIKTLLMRRPSSGLAKIVESAWNDEAEALVDPDKSWYWFGRNAPDLDLLHEQYDAYQAILRREGVDIVMAPDLEPHFTKSVFTRDPLVTVPGGAVILRLAPRMRRGEEQSIAATVAGAGMPILGTLTGTAIAEGGSFVKLRRDLAAFGTSIRCNKEGFAQLERILDNVGMRALEVPLPGYLIHIDGAIMMIDEDLAMIDSRLLPYEFLTALRDLGIETVEVPDNEPWAVNSLTIAPRRVLMADHLPETAELLNNRFGVEIIPVPFSEMAKNGGSLHCTTMELRREW